MPKYHKLNYSTNETKVSTTIIKDNILKIISSSFVETVQPDSKTHFGLIANSKTPSVSQLVSSNLTTNVSNTYPLHSQLNNSTNIEDTSLVINKNDSKKDENNTPIAKYYQSPVILANYQHNIVAPNSIDVNKMDGSRRDYTSVNKRILC